MSIDIYLVINTGIAETYVLGVGNMTHNVQPMWRKAITETSDLTMSLCDFDGWLASAALKIIVPALNHMRCNENEYTPLNPKNGWGSYETAVEFLDTLVSFCSAHPACTIKTSC